MLSVLSLFIHRLLLFSMLVENFSLVLGIVSLKSFVIRSMCEL